MRALYRWMKAHLAEHKMPARWWLLDAIPRTSRGKINREPVQGGLRRPAAAGPAPHPREQGRHAMTVSASNAGSDLLRFLRTHPEAEQADRTVGDDESLVESGLIDSLAIVQIVVYLEEHLRDRFRGVGLRPRQARLDRRASST